MPLDYRGPMPSAPEPSDAATPEPPGVPDPSGAPGPSGATSPDPSGASRHSGTSGTAAASDATPAIMLRPRGATVLCIVVGLMALGLTLDAVLRAGWEGVFALPVLLLIAALVWMVLWRPRVLVRPDEVEVRNVFVTHLVPFAVVEQVRLGAMLRLDVATDKGARTITAWNAPGIGRDNPLRRQAVLREQDLRGRRLTAPERLVHDQERSRSAVVVDAFEAWREQTALRARAGKRGTGTDAAGGTDAAAAGATAGTGAGQAMVTRPNVLEIAVVPVCLALAGLRVLL